MTPRLTLRIALREALTAQHKSVLAFCERLGLSRSEYTAVNRWVRGQYDARTKRPFPLPLRLRVRVARAIGWEGKVLSAKERRAFGVDSPFSPSPPLPSEERREEQEEEGSKRGQN